MPAFRNHSSNDWSHLIIFLYIYFFCVYVKRYRATYGLFYEKQKFPFINRKYALIHILNILFCKIYLLKNCKPNILFIITTKYDFFIFLSKIVLASRTLYAITQWLLMFHTKSSIEFRHTEKLEKIYQIHIENWEKSVMIQFFCLHCYKWDKVSNKLKAPV